MDFRPITQADLATCADVFWVADDDLMMSLGLPTNPHNEARVLALFDHIVANDARRCWLAEDRGRSLGFAMSVQRGEMTFLSMLFVLPDSQGRGLGRELLERSMAGSTKRGVCIFSAQPISAALYARYGMVPRVPMYTLMGRPKTALPSLDRGLRIGPVAVAAVESVDVEVEGFARAIDHAAWERWDRTRYGLFDGDEVLGYAYAQVSGRLGPVVVRRPELALPLIGRLMQEVEPIEDWMINVPGPAAEPFEALLKAGMRLDGPPIIYCATDESIDHSRYLPSTFALP